MKTIDYYNKNAISFYDRTIGVDISKTCDKFLAHLPKNARILDAGCGSGRDSKYFLRKGYTVTAFDASQEMCTLASKETGLSVQHLTFQDMPFIGDFEGIWANASLLHVPYGETKEVYEKIHKALAPKGIFYGCYKYGEDYITTPEREFWNMNEITILPYFEGLFEVLEIWKEKDTRGRVSPNPENSWLYFIVRKN
jgi:SAM-dependent methyltransferase